MKDERSVGQREPPWRLFVAISLPDSVKAEIEKLQMELRQVFRNDVRWTRREQFHLTLKFLGAVDPQAVDELIVSLHSACEHLPSLQARAEGIGCFPSLRHPRVLWVGVNDAGERLSLVQSAVERAVDRFSSEQSEVKFSGHVTLGRIQRMNHTQTETLANLADKMASHSFGEWDVKQIELIRSELGAGGSRYTTLAEIPLREEAVGSRLNPQSE